MADLMDTMNEAIDHYEKPQHSKSPLPPHSPPTQAPPSPNSPRPNPNGCACCQQDFRRHEEPIMFQRRLYHERCFTCTTCNIPLDIRRANEHNDHLYCPRDFASIKKSIRCAHCHDEIEDHVPVVKALGNYYHPGHINCYECHTPLDDRTSFREHQGRVYCKRDYRKMTLPKCRGCGKTVEKEAVSSKELKGKWHVSCFGCQTCHASFPDSTFYIYDSAPYCRRHYHQLNNSLCRSCDDPLW
ncbi:hypothetical protein DM01DRAFT_1092392 [Hesseltinella vesiculosa]|uniref:LIM zinc-binding domain-containing protein n=1 Tax=Hesseltinella vesiculosa TaxID=101127 RepID=A0A1X2GD12_9FUNG|nr:hypothetical protein DM01DRAFT_1092392 [Hesseltinella vesiculosa]